MIAPISRTLLLVRVRQEVCGEGVRTVHLTSTLWSATRVQGR
jgi:hypothetical protein